MPYILQNPKGVYLEIGTRGNPIAEMLNKIPEDSKITLTASDIDENILKVLPKRHPELKKYIMETFFKGAFRVLKPESILVYRDPEEESPLEYQNLRNVIYKIELEYKN